MVVVVKASSVAIGKLAAAALRLGTVVRRLVIAVMDASPEIAGRLLRPRMEPVVLPSLTPSVAPGPKVHAALLLDTVEIVMLTVVTAVSLDHATTRLQILDLAKTFILTLLSGQVQVHRPHAMLLAILFSRL
jgi:hypothetical protein